MTPVAEACSQKPEFMERPEHGIFRWTRYPDHSTLNGRNGGIGFAGFVGFFPAGWENCQGSFIVHVHAPAPFPCVRP